MKITSKACLFLAVLVLSAAKCGAQLYYTGGTTGTWTTDTSVAAGQVWAASSGGAASSWWTDLSSAVIQTSGATITVGSSTTAINVTDLTLPNGTLFVPGGNNYQLNINGAGSGDFTMNSITGFRFRVSLQGSSAYNGTITVANGTAGVDADLLLSNATGAGTATHVQLAAGGEIIQAFVGNVTIGELSGASGKITPQFGTAVGLRTLTVNQATTTTYGGTFEAGTAGRSLSLTKSGTGSLTLNNAAIGTVNQLNANGGTLFVNGGLTVANNAASGNTTVTSVSVGSGGTLAGSGTITFGSTAVGTENVKGVDVQSGGILAPGGAAATAGTLTIAGTTGPGLTFEGAATIDFELGTAKDLITLSGSTMTGSALGGAGSVMFIFDDTGVVNGTTYDLISFGGTAQGIALDTFTASGVNGTFQYGGDGNTLQFTAAVPEPSTVALVGMFLMGGLLFRFNFKTRLA